MTHTRLSVNVNKLATLRNSRGKNNPDVLKMTLEIIAYGAQGITVHPRPDGRHIRTEDVIQIAENIKVEFNVEGYPDKHYLELVRKVKPTQCTLVPDPPDVLTSNAGWKVEKNQAFLKEILDELHKHNIRTSLFIDPYDFTQNDLASLKNIQADRVELYTESYADAFKKDEKTKLQTLSVYQDAADKINKAGIDINAGHDLNLDNLSAFVKAIPTLKEVSIGHALICDALEYGMKETVKKYLACLKS